MPSTWCSAEGVYIPKEENSVEIGSFRPISLLDVEGKILLGVFAARMGKFLLDNGYIDTSVQKTGIPGFPGCVEHTAMIWHTIQVARVEKSDLSVIWLDLANAYGSIPHSLISFSMDFFHIPEKLQKFLMCYYDQFQMRFTTASYTTRWQDLQVGIPMGCTISPILFVMAMEVIIRGARDCGSGVEIAPGTVLPPIRAFMDDLTVLTTMLQDAENLLARLDELIEWARMKFKPRKSRSLLLERGKVSDHHFKLGEDTIPTLSEQPVKSLGRLYTEDLKDTKRVNELNEDLDSWLDKIEKCGLPGRFKVWCLKFGVMPRLMWRLTVYEIAMSHVETMEIKISVKIRMWLGVPRNLTNIAFYGHLTKLRLPLSSLVEEYQVAKVRMVMTLRDSNDPVIRDVVPDVKAGRKWNPHQEVDDMEARLRHKDIVGFTQTGRAGLGSQAMKYFSRAGPVERREMVSEEVRNKWEEIRQSKAAGMALQGSWTRWEAVEPRTISWSELWAMEPALSRFIIKSTYDALPSPANLAIWGLADNSDCPKCHQRGTLLHILCACPQSLTMYTWRHNQVLDSIRTALTPIIAKCNSQPLPSKPKSHIPFVKEGVPPSSRKPQPAHGLLSKANDWELRCDLDSQLVFPPEVAITPMRPDLVIWSPAGKMLIIGELTVPWEDNVEERHEFKKAKYQDLTSDCAARGWNTYLMPFEVGCRGFYCNTLSFFLSRLGVGNRTKRKIAADAAAAASRGSAWIWQKHCQQSRSPRSAATPAP